MNNILMLDLLIFIFLTFSRIYSFYYCITYDNIVQQYKDSKLFIILKSNVSYTNYGLNLLYIWFFIKYYFNYNIPEFNYSIWCINFTISLAYWSLNMYIVDNNKPKSDTILYKSTDILCHGGINLLTTFTLLDNNINYYNIFYTMLLSAFWFIFILIPWKHYTNDNIYVFLNDTYSPIFKSIIIFTIIYIHILSCSVAIYISNYIIT